MTGKASRDRRQVRRTHLQWEEEACEEATAATAEEEEVPETPEQEQELRTKKPSRDRRAQRRAHLQWSKAQDDASTMAPSSGSARSSLGSILSEEAHTAWEEEEDELTCSLTCALDFSTPCAFPMRIRLASEVEAQAVVRRSFIHIQEDAELEACTRSAPANMLSSGFNMATGRYEEEEQDEEEEEEVFERNRVATLSDASLDAWYCNTIKELSARHSLLPCIKVGGGEVDDSCSLCSTASTDASEACVAVKNTFVELCALEGPARRRSSRGIATYAAEL